MKVSASDTNYLANREEVYQYLLHQGELWTQLKERLENQASLAVQRLRPLAAEAGSHAQ